MSSMSRIAKKEVVIPPGVTVTIDDKSVSVTGKHGKLDLIMHPELLLKQEDQSLKISIDEKFSSSVVARQMSGTTRALLENMVKGVSERFEKKLELRGVGYRASVKGKEIILNLGKSHPDAYAIPESIDIEVIKNTNLIVKGCDKQKVGQVSAELRNFRPPERYKGKGIRYIDEIVKLKETKKK